MDVASELGRARAALGVDVRVDSLASVEERPCTLDTLIAALREGPDILYLVCHGTNRQGTPILWLEDRNGGLDRVEGAVLTERIAALPRPPTLVVLASCESMGAGDDQRTLAALGPRLAAAATASACSRRYAASESRAYWSVRSTASPSSTSGWRTDRTLSTTPGRRWCNAPPSPAHPCAALGGDKRGPLLVKMPQR